MRRFAAALTLAFVVLTVVVASRSSDGDGYRVDAVFDTAKGMVPGQLVKVAGARVGRVTGVHLESRTSARISMEVQARVAPFHAGASCRILPEGLISENYVECDPGDRRKPPLPRTKGTATVGLEDTTIPVGLQDVLDVFSVPVDQRIRVLLNELGLGTAGRGGDINAVLRRANPSLLQARALVEELNGQRRQLADAVVQTDAVLGRLADDSQSVRAFIANATATTATTAAHAPGLSAAIERLPAMLEAADGGLASIRRTTTRVTPLLGDLRQAAPGARELTETLPAFTAAGLPALQSLRRATQAGIPALNRARPVIGSLRRTLAVVDPVSGQLSAFLTSLRDSGGVENVLRVFYTLAVLSGTYDGTSHILTFFANVSGECIADPSGSGCSHAYYAPEQGAVPVNTGSAPAMSDARSRDLLDYLIGK